MAPGNVTEAPSGGPFLANVNETDDLDERTPLHWAAKAGNAKLVRLLLRSGASPDAADGESGWTALHFAAAYGRAAAARALLAGGAKRTVLDGERRLPSQCAAEAGNSKLVALLLPAPLEASS